MQIPKGHWTVVDEPADGWQGFLNIFRRLLGKPIRMRRVHTFEFDEPVVILPGQSVTLALPVPPLDGQEK